MANVLPPEYKEKITTEYRLRLLAVGLLLGGIALAITAAFLVPSYLLLRSHLSTTQDNIARVQEAFQQESGGRYTQVLSDTKQQLSAASLHGRTTKIGAMFKEVLDRQSQGVSITRFAYTDEEKTLVISGVADTRDALLGFEESLATSQLFAEVDLPVSSLADQTDVAFNLDLRLSDSGNNSQ